MHFKKDTYKQVLWDLTQLSRSQAARWALLQAKGRAARAPPHPTCCTSLSWSPSRPGGVGTPCKRGLGWGGRHAATAERWHVQWYKEKAVGCQARARASTLHPTGWKSHAGRRTPMHSASACTTHAHVLCAMHRVEWHAARSWAWRGGKQGSAPMPMPMDDDNPVQGRRSRTHTAASEQH